MSDPLFEKLKADAKVVFKELCRAMTHRPEQQEWRDPSGNPPASEMAVLEPKPVTSAQSGLHYFHLN